MRRFLLSIALLALAILVSTGDWGCASSGSENGFDGGPGEDTGGGGHLDTGLADGGGHNDVGTFPDVGGGGHKDGSGDGSLGEGGEGGKPGKLTIGGTVTGLTGSGLVLEDNGSDNLSITKNGSFTFAVPVSSGGTYAVTVSIQPVSPAQTCTVSGGTGTVGTSDVTSVVVNCAANTYTIGGMISGLSGSVVLQDNGGDNLTLTANGSFAFATPVAEGDAYAVTVFTQPSLPSQTCTVTPGTGSGTVAMADVTSVLVTCTTNTFTVGGTVSGLAGSGLVLLDNGGDSLPISTNGTFTFATPLASGSSYTVSFMTQPSAPTQICTLMNGVGTVTTADITNVDVTCTTQSYTIGGNLSGLASGDTITLLDNGGDSLPLTANGSFTFATPVLSGATYAVTVGTPPSSPPQSCNVSMGTGTVGSADVVSVSVTCTTTTGCGRFTSGYTGAWATVAANPFGATMGISSYMPSGTGATIYLNEGALFDEYSSSTNTYTGAAAPPVSFTSYGNTAWQGNALWAITGSDVIRYDLTLGTWTTPKTGVTTAGDNQTASDDSGNLWSYESESALVQYNVASGTITYHTLPTALTLIEPRITFDSCSGLLYLTDYDITALYSYNPTSGVQTALASSPLAIQDGFCGDRSGHLFTVTVSAQAYQYTISTNTWAAMPTGGPVGDLNSACGVGADGYLYASDPAESTAMYRIQLK